LTFDLKAKIDSSSQRLCLPGRQHIINICSVLLL